MAAVTEVCEKRLGVASGSSRPRARGPASNRHGSGTLRGKHYTEYVEVVKTLRREGHEEAAEQLLLELVEVVEAEATDEGSGVAPWYYEQLREPRAHRISVIMMKKNMKTATRTKSSSRLSYHDRRLARRLKEESVFRAEFQRCSRALRPDP